MKRPFHCVSSVGGIAHHAFELAAGCGLVFQPQLGLGGSLLLWSAVFPTFLVMCTRGSARWDNVLAFLMGGNLAAGAVHFTLWPWRMRRGVPVLTEAEGLPSDILPLYNSILYMWSLPALLALARETPAGARRWGVIGFGSAFVFRSSAVHHFEWLREQARTNPAWWNRAVRAA